MLPDENGDEILIEALEYGKKKEEVTARLVMPENLRSKACETPIVIDGGDYPLVYKTISEMIAPVLQNRKIAECEGM